MTGQTVEITAKDVKERVKAALDGQGEHAFLDVREEGVYARGHCLYAACCPLSRLELLVRDLVPRPTTPLTVMDGGGDEGLAARAATKLAQLGYGDVAILADGLKAWAAAEFEVFGGMNVPSKAFGELVEQTNATPHITAHQLKIMMDRGDDLVVLDSRPMDEFRMMNIPTATDCPTSELVYRIGEIAPDADTRVVINCAGRTRSIIGAQTLLNAGIPNEVVALENGTMGWHLAGYSVERGNERKPPEVGKQALEQARARARAVAEKAGVEVIDQATLERFQAEQETRTLYVFDVRTGAEYAASHLAGARPAIGVQLVQKTDSFMATLGARVVCVDDTGPRALTTAAWLAQMGWQAYVLDGGLESGPKEAGAFVADVPEADHAGVESISSKMLAVANARGAALVLDFTRSLDYAKGHIPGARFAIRARLGDTLPRLDQKEMVVLTSDDGRLARLAAAEAQAAASVPVKVLDGGNAAWRRDKLPLADGTTDAADPVEDDAFWRPYERSDGVEDAMHQYLSWEQGLVEQIARDGTAPFKVLEP
jgi:rhodanese-related sulfurtransferase